MKKEKKLKYYASPNDLMSRQKTRVDKRKCLFLYFMIIVILVINVDGTAFKLICWCHIQVMLKSIGDMTQKRICLALMFTGGRGQGYFNSPANFGPEALASIIPNEGTLDTWHDTF